MTIDTSPLRQILAASTRGRRIGTAHMCFMLSPEDLGLPTPNQATTIEEVETTRSSTGLPPLVPGSTTAKALYEVWSGTELVVVDSPPGAGKTQTIVTIVGHLLHRTQMDMCIATATRKQALDLAMRLTEVIAPEQIYLQISGLDPAEMPEGVISKETTKKPATWATSKKIRLRTVASCRMNPDAYDLLIFDEAYQSTFAAISVAAKETAQILLVGDPGQIGPVVTCDTSAWDHRKQPPHHPAPEVLKNRDGAHLLHMDATWRLGPATVEAIAPLYDFDFASNRPDRFLEGYDEIESVTVKVPETPYDLDLLGAVVERVSELAETTLIEDGQKRALTPEDIGVVVSHNAQASTVGAMLRAQGLEGVTVGTADRLQGSQWHAVVAVDPLCGHEGVSPHALALGRLCVMASRHMTHLTWMHDGRWGDQLKDDEVSKLTGRVGRKVREALCR